jgi:hypothetical protein
VCAARPATAAISTQVKRRRQDHMVCAPSSFAHPTGIEPTTSCLQTAESQIPHKMRLDVVLACGTLSQIGVPIEYQLPAKTRRLAGTSSYGANRDRTGDLLLAKQALSQLSYGPWKAQDTRWGAGFDAQAALRPAASAVASGARLPISATSPRLGFRSDIPLLTELS